MASGAPSGPCSHKPHALDFVRWHPLNLLGGNLCTIEHKICLLVGSGGDAGSYRHPRRAMRTLEHKETADERYDTLSPWHGRPSRAGHHRRRAFRPSRGGSGHRLRDDPGPPSLHARRHASLPSLHPNRTAITNCLVENIDHLSPACRTVIASRR